MKTIRFFLAALVAFVLTSCGAGDVPYTVMDNYFVNNTVTEEPPTVIDNAQDFNTYFGMATVMGPDGTPTEVDFDKHFVVAITHPETDLAVEILPVGAKEKEGQLVVSYKIEVGDGRRTYTTHPLLLLRFDRKYSKEVVFNEVK